MANSFVYAEQYLPLLDEVYKASSKAAILDATKVEIVNGNTVKVYKTTMDGLGNYDRNAGFLGGDVTGTWETMTLTQDRGRSFVVDTMSDQETLGMAFGTLAGGFVREKVTPEVDSYTFAKLAGVTGISKGTAADITVGTTDVATMVDEAERQMNEDEVPTEGRILFISETAYAGLKNKISRQIENRDGVLNNGILMYNDMRVIRVPQTRFYTAITLADGKTSGQTAGGYTPATGAKKINFMIVHPSAVNKVVKHVIPRIFTPAQNFLSDGYRFNYRIYHDVFAYENKVKGIYLHTGATNV